MMLTMVALISVLVLASLLWRRSGRRPLHLIQFRPVAPLAGPASTARVQPRTTS